MSDVELFQLFDVLIQTLIVLFDIEKSLKNETQIFGIAHAGAFRIQAQELIEFLYGLRVIPLRVVVVREDKCNVILCFGCNGT